MHAVRLVREDTGEVVAWACGKCNHVPGVESYENGKMRASAIATMQESAEHCCRCDRCGDFRGPRTTFLYTGFHCAICKPIADKEEEERLRGHHAERERAAEARRASLVLAENEDAALRLLDEMTDFSESRWCAQWNGGNEYEAWEAFLSGAPDTAEIAKLYPKSGGWWVWDDTFGTQIFIRKKDWIERFAEWKLKNSR